MFIVAIGNVDLGHVFIGPFRTEEGAQDWIDHQDSRISMVAWPLPVKSPEDAVPIMRKHTRPRD